MSWDKIVNSKQEYDKLLKLVNKAFYIEKRLPEQVFVVPSGKKCVIDFDKAMGYSFWNELERLVALSNDSFILMAVLDPHPEDYYYEEFSLYNWYIFPNGSTADDYWNAINWSPADSPADAIVFNSEVVVWLSPTLKWAIWGERRYGICILALSEEIDSYTSEFCLSIETAITDLVSLNFGSELPDEIESKLLFFYGGKK